MQNLKNLDKKFSATEKINVYRPDFDFDAKKM